MNEESRKTAKLEPEAEEPVSIQKPPEEFSLERFKSKRTAAIANVETLHEGLPCLRMPEAKDFVRLHPDVENYWSDELCFVNVPVKGQKHDTVHLIDDDLAALYVPSGRLMHYRLVLATKPFDVFFLCQVPTRNLDNSWNSTYLEACEQARTLWTQLSSRYKEGVEGYTRDFSRDPDAYPQPKWPTELLGKLILRTYTGRAILADDHPGLLRIIGAKPKLT
jgi:hypothetical protein